MLRSLVSFIARSAAPGAGGREAPSHAKVLQNRLVRDQAFADSGYWDYALLTAYDTGMRKVVLGGVTALSELGWTERALIGSSRALNFAPAHGPLGMFKNLASVFAHLGLNLSFTFVGLASYWAASGSVVLPLRLADVPAALRGAAETMWAAAGADLHAQTPLQARARVLGRAANAPALAAAPRAHTLRTFLTAGPCGLHIQVDGRGVGHPPEEIWSFPLTPGLGGCFFPRHYRHPNPFIPTAPEAAAALTRYSMGGALPRAPWARRG